MRKPISLYKINFVIMVLLLVSCSSIVYVDSKDFIQIGSRIGQINSATFTQYIGHSRDRAYIEDFSAIRFGKNKTVVYWTELKELPDSIRSIIAKNKNPWVLWLESHQIDSMQTEEKKNARPKQFSEESVR